MGRLHSCTQCGYYGPSKPENFPDCGQRCHCGTVVKETVSLAWKEEEGAQPRRVSGFRSWKGQ